MKNSGGKGEPNHEDRESDAGEKSYVKAGRRGKPFFPCPICCCPRDVRESKKQKPYIVCDACGMQLFVRGKDGIQRFNRLIDETAEQDLWQRLETMKSRYLKHCPKCGQEFVAEDRLIESHWFDGHFIGYRCPNPDCNGIVPPEED